MKISRVSHHEGVWHYAFIEDDGKVIAHVQGVSFREVEQRAKRIIAAEAKLARLRELEAKWRAYSKANYAFEQRTYQSHAVDFLHCADELAEILRGD